MKRKTFLKALLSFSILPLFGGKKDEPMFSPAIASEDNNQTFSIPAGAVVDDIKYPITISDNIEIREIQIKMTDGHGRSFTRTESIEVTVPKHLEGEWIHISGAWSADGTKKLFVNGIEQNK